MFYGEILRDNAATAYFKNLSSIYIFKSGHYPITVFISDYFGLNKYVVAFNYLLVRSCTLTNGDNS